MTMPQDNLANIAGINNIVLTRYYVRRIDHCLVFKWKLSAYYTAEGNCSDKNAH